MDALHLATMRFHAAAEAEVAQLVGAWARPAAMRAAKPAVLAAARWWSTRSITNGSGKADYVSSREASGGEHVLSTQ